jgi:hypothetical protein
VATFFSGKKIIINFDQNMGWAKVWAFFSQSHLVTLISAQAQRFLSDQGCQIFLGATYQNHEKYTTLPYKILKGHKTSKISVKYSK